MKEGYHLTVVETYHESGDGLHGDVHVRNIPELMRVNSCNEKSMRRSKIVSVNSACFFFSLH